MVKTAFILTALQCECDAILSHLEDIQECEHPTVGTAYWVGNFPGWRVAVAEIGAGNINAALETERAFVHFSPEVALFVGVAGGLKDVNLGDVVVGTKIYGYHSGKALEDFRPRPDVGQCSHRLIQRAISIRRSESWLKRIETVTESYKPKVVTGPIAAGEQVIASVRSDTFNFLQQQYGDAVAVEMEGRGFLSAAFAHPEVQVAVIRGVSDLIEKKSISDAAGSQILASANAAALAIELLASLSRSVGVESGGPKNHQTKTLDSDSPSVGSESMTTQDRLSLAGDHGPKQELYTGFITLTSKVFSLCFDRQRQMAPGRRTTISAVSLPVTKDIKSLRQELQELFERISLLGRSETCKAAQEIVQASIMVDAWSLTATPEGIENVEIQHKKMLASRDKFLAGARSELGLDDFRILKKESNE